MKFYVVGLGSIGLRHAKNLLAMGHEVYGFDTEKIVMERAYTHGVKRIRSEGGEVDAWVIATPTRNHLEKLKSALQCQIPVFVEKPIVHNEQLGEGVDKLLPALFHAAPPVLVAIGNNLRFHPSVQALKKDILENKLGSPMWAFISCAQYNEKPDYLRDGVTLNWGAHEIDLALYLFGPARLEASSIDAKDTIADLCLTHGEHYCTRSNIHLDYLTRPEARMLMVFGTKGQACVDLPARTLMTSYEGKPGHWLGTGSYDLDYYNEMQAFVDAVEGKKPWPGATASEALEVLKIIDEAKRFAIQKDQRDSGAFV